MLEGDTGALFIVIIIITDLFFAYILYLYLINTYPYSTVQILGDVPVNQ